MTCSSKEWRHKALLDAITYEPIGLFDLTIGLRMSNKCKADINSSVFAELHELSRSEVRAIVGDDTVRNPESARNHLEEVDHCGSASVRDRYGFDPFGKLIDGDEQMSVFAMSGPGQWTNHIEPPLGERPGYGDHVELRGWYVRPFRKPLTSFALHHQILCVLSCCGPDRKSVV